MKQNCLKTSLLLAALLLFACRVSYASEETAKSQTLKLQIQSAEKTPGSLKTTILAASRAGTRIVAVGERGVILISDDDGSSYRQAKSVPVSSTLNGIWFADATTGWAVGHWGAILRSSDSGETWAVQRSDTQVDQPLFSVHFINKDEGWAVGLWSLMLHTIDAGAHWTTVTLPPPPGVKNANRNLYEMFASAKGTLFIACEQGRILRSSDRGVTWQYVETGYAGSFWSGLSLADGTLLVGGLRGTIYRSADDGKSWNAIATPFKSSITGMVQLNDNSVRTVGLDGVSMISKNDGASFQGLQKSNRETLTAVIDSGKGFPLQFSINGPVASR